MAGARRPTDILKEEHENVLKKLDSLEQVIGRLNEKEKVAAQLKELASFFEIDFWVHFDKEEKALFPELEKFIPRESGPIGVMLIEHDDLRKTNAEIQRAARDYLGGSDNLGSRAVLQNHGTHFITVLRDHINKENNILFMMADMHLDAAQRNAVLKLFETIETSGGKRR